MFFEFRQNNSYGDFKHDVASGIGALVIIEAESRDAAMLKAETIGLYFDGAGDCPCCGNRWSPLWSDEDGEESIADFYGVTEDHKFVDSYALSSSLRDGVYGYVHYANGNIAPLDFVKVERRY